MKIALPKIYPITDVRISGLSHIEQVKRLVDGGASWIQLREKDASSGEFYGAAAEAVKVAHAQGATIVINDRVDIAIASGADGVHLGQDDLPPEHARRLLGAEAIIGYSTHSEAQAVAAMKLPIDYIAIGPVFSTSTKLDHERVVGLEVVRRVRSVIGNFPLVAIGGINAENAASVREAGADSVAMISTLLSSPDHITSSMRGLSESGSK